MRLILLLAVVLAGLGLYRVMSLTPQPKPIPSDALLLDELGGELRGQGYACPALKGMAGCVYPLGGLTRYWCGPNDGTDKVFPDQVYMQVIDGREPVPTWQGMNGPPRPRARRWEGDPNACPKDPFVSAKSN